NSQPSTLFSQRLQAVLSAGGFCIASGVVTERVVICRQLQVQPFFLDQVRGLRIEFNRMLYSVRAGFHAVPQPLPSERVTRSLLAVAMRFVNDGFHFFLCKSWLTKQPAAGFKLVIGGGVKLDPVRSIMNLFAHRLARGPGSIHSLVIAWQIHFRRAKNAFAGGHQAHGGNLQAWPRKITAVNGFLNIDVSVPTTVTHEV